MGGWKCFLQGRKATMYYGVPKIFQEALLPNGKYGTWKRMPDSVSFSFLPKARRARIFLILPFQSAMAFLVNIQKANILIITIFPIMPMERITGPRKWRTYVKTVVSIRYRSANPVFPFNRKRSIK